MPVQIDHIDTEIEIAPGPSREDAASAAATAASAAPAASGSASSPDAFRRAVVAALEAELDAYLRSRG